MIRINFEKAKIISHERRRAFRSMEFAPYDEIIAKQIPGEVENAELERQKIRDKYAEMQIKIDLAKNLDELDQVTP